MKTPFEFTKHTKTPMTENHVRRARELNSAYDRTKVEHGSIAQKAGSIRNILTSMGVDNFDTRVLMYLFPLVRDGAFKSRQIEAKSYTMVNQYFSTEMAREIRFMTPQFILPEITNEEKSMFDASHPEVRQDFQGFLENRIFQRYIELKSNDAARVVFIADALSYEGRFGTPLYKALKFNLLKDIKEYVSLRTETARENLEETKVFAQIYLPEYPGDTSNNDDDVKHYSKILSVWQALEELVDRRLHQLNHSLQEVHRVSGTSLYKEETAAQIKFILDHL